MAPIMKDIYEQLKSILGGTDANQFLHLVVPGTMLNQSDFAYDTTAAKPQTVAAAESRLVDQMFDLAEISGSSSGQRVSSQYLQALSVLVPNFDPLMPTIKSELRQYLATPAPPNAKVDGTPFVGTIEDHYFALYENWLAKKSAWETEVIDQKYKTTPEKFMEWYESVAETELAKIDAARGRLLAVFSPSDMDAILGTLDSGPNGEIEEAVNTVLDIRTPSPQGGFIYPVDLTPSDWFLDLSSDLAPEDLLADPAFIALTLESRQSALSATVAQLQALVAQMPSSADLTTATAGYAAAQQQFTSAQQSLDDKFSANTVTGASMILRALNPTNIATNAIDQLDTAVGQVGAQRSNNAAPARAALIDGSPISQADIVNLASGMTALTKAQTALTTSAADLASAGVTLASTKAAALGDAPAVLARLQQQLKDVQSLRDQLAAAQTAAPRAAIVADKVDVPALLAKLEALTAPTPAAWLTAAWAVLYPDSKTDPGPQKDVLGDGYVAWSKAVAQAGVKANDDVTGAIAAVLEALDSTSADSAAAIASRVQDAFNGLPEKVLTKDPATGPLGTLHATVNASPAPDNYAATVRTTANALVRLLDSWTKEFQDAADKPYTVVGTAPAKDGVSTQIGTGLPTDAGGDPHAAPWVMGKITDAAASAPTLATVKSAVMDRTQSIVATAPSSGKSGTSDRWMEFRFSTTLSEMTQTATHESHSEESSWHVDFFFGSAGGSSSLSESQQAVGSHSKSTTIEIGMKATKVDIERGWFDPGVFRLTNSLSRISKTAISDGPVPLPLSDTSTANDCILPCFPVAFVVAKDVTIKFELDESDMDSVQSVLDSRSAVGGGFLCFSASSSSASHSDASQLSTKTSGTVVNINMPGPQILGWFLQYTPVDGSHVLKSGPLDRGQIDVMDYIQALSSAPALTQIGSTATTPVTAGSATSAVTA